MYSKKIAFLVLSGTLAILATSAAAEQLVTSLPDGSKLELTLPASWQSTHQTAGPSVTVRLSPAGSGAFVVLLTVLPVKAGAPASTPEGVRAVVAEQGNRALSSALQDHLEITEIKGPQTIGYIFHATDRSPEKGPGDYRESNQGAILVGQHLISVTILTHPGDSTTVDEAKRMLATARIGLAQDATGNSASDPKEVYEIGLPEAGWTVALALPGYRIMAEQERPDGQGKMMQASNDRTQMIISVFVEREPGLGSSKKCRDFYWAKDRRSPIPKSEIVLSERDSMALVTWMVKEFQGSRVMQRNVKAFLGHEDACVDIHLSKVNFRTSDEQLFDAVLQSIQIREQPVKHQAPNPGAAPN